jgi:hypothetical protein
MVRRVDKGDNMSAKAKFCASLPWQVQIHWYDLTGVVQLDDERFAKLELCTRETAGVYRGFTAKIVNKTRGVIDCKTFLFDDYLNDRNDKRSDYPLYGNHCFSVHSSCGWDWHIAIPNRPETFTQAIEFWIQEFSKAAIG